MHSTHKPEPWYGDIELVDQCGMFLLLPLSKVEYSVWHEHIIEQLPKVTKSLVTGSCKQER